MADFRRWILALAVLALVTGLASAQTPTSGTGQMSCVAASQPNNLRGEGFTELTGDVTITCTGGPQTLGYSVGSAIPTANITVYVNGTITSRLLGSGGLSEALLLIDEPGSGLVGPVPGFGSNASQIACGNPTGGAGPGGTNPCVAYYQNGAGNIPVAAATSTTTSQFTQAANVFQGIVTGGQVTFYGVPVLPPVSSTAARVFRITNIRVNANGITGGGPIPANVTESFAISGAGGFTVQNNGLTTGFIQTSLATSLRNAGSTSGLASGGAPYLQCQSQSSPVPAATLRYAESNFGSAFKTRVAVNAMPAGSSLQSNAVTQNVPGTLYYSESGFITGVVPGAGLADFGTRVKAVFNNIPAGVSIYVTLGQTSTSTAGATAVLITGETSPENGSTVPAVTQTTVAGGNAIALLANINNSATAVWEVTATQPNLNETLDFGMYIQYTANPANNVPAAPATMTVNMSYAPTPTAAFSASAGAAASSSLPIPRFADTSTARNALAISICQTALLFPYITNTNGFDTGVAIANTSVDPFGTAAQNGTCTLYWYGNATTSSNPAATTLGGGGVGTTTAIAAGTVQSALVSTTVAGFQGYMIAVCNFQYAHGFAFVSDIGARNLAMGYLALILNPSSIANRGPAAAESLDN